MKSNILQKAIQLAHESYSRKYKICAIITNKKNNILSVGFNSFEKSSPLQKKYADRCGFFDKIYSHAEINAIIKLPYGKIPHAIYIARVNNFGKPMNSSPCEICTLAIKDLKIKKVYHT